MANKKIYLIREFGGEYEDSWERIVFAYLNKKNRDEKLRELNNRNEELESYRSLWEEISNDLDNIEYPEEYYKYCNCEIEGPKYDAIYENYTPEDSFERFKYWMNEIIPNTYKSQSEEFWKNLYDYYQVNSCQYGSLYTSYFDAQDVEISDAE